MAFPSTNSIPVIAPITADRMPLHYGAATTVAAVTSVLRLQEQGYRLHFVDMLSELLEGDPHAQNCVLTRTNAVAGRPWEIAPAETQNEAEAKNAQVIADFVCAAIKAIPHWRQHMGGLLHAFVVGTTAREIMWKRGPRGEYLIDSLEFVHSRRLAYDWDWNLVWTNYGQSNEGHPLADYPHKFIVFEWKGPEEYPTRQGLGRTLLYWLAFARFGVRELLTFVERFGKPYVDVEWAKGENEPADEDDIANAKDLAKRFGAGSMAGCAHPSTVKASLMGNGSSNAGSGGSGESTPHKALKSLADEQVSKLVLGQAYTTNAGQKTGLGNSGDPFADASQVIYRSDAGQLECVIDEYVIKPLVLLNFGPEAVAKYLPHYRIEIEDPEDEKSVMDRIDMAVRVGYPMPTAFVSDRFGWPLPQEGDEVLAAAGLPRAYSVPEIGDDEPDDSQDGKETSKPGNVDEDDTDDDKGEE